MKESDQIFKRVTPGLVLVRWKIDGVTPKKKILEQNNKLTLN